MRKGLFTILLLLFVAVSCRKDGASWNTNWVVPIINDSLLINDYVNDSTLAINPDNSVQMIIDRKLLNLNVLDIIEIPDTLIDQELAINLLSLQVNPGFDFLNEIEEHLFELDDVVLLEARVKSGKAKIKIMNPIETNVIFTISLPGVTKDGLEFSHTQMVESGTIANPGVGELELNFKGYTIDFTGANGSLYNILQSRLKVKSDPNGPVVTITNQDLFKFQIEFQKLRFDYGRGYFGRHNLTDTTEVDLTVLNNIVGGNINIDDIDLELIIRNGIKAPARGNISLFESENTNQNSIVALNHPYFGQLMNLNPATGQWDGLTPTDLAFRFNENSGNLKDFLENLGSKYRVGYAVEINPFGNTSAGNNILYPNSRVSVDLVANFPLRIGVDNLIFQDTFAIDFKNEDKLLRIEEGKFVLDATNSFPFGLKVDLVLLDEGGNALKTLLTNGQISPAQANSSANGHVPVKEKMEFIIDKQAAKLLKDTKSVMVRAYLSSTEYQNNVMYSNAALKFILFGHLKLRTEI